MAEVRGKKSNIGVLVLAFLVFALGGAAGYLYYQYSISQNELSRLQDPQYLSDLQDQQVVATLDKLGLIMLLPEEDPTVATLIDAEALRQENEAFYKNAQNGDKLIIYTEQAILFREEENKIINVAPVFIDPNQEQAEVSDVVVDDTEESDSTEVSPPISNESACEDLGATWLSEYSECETSSSGVITESWCEDLGGSFEGCASACRHDASTDYCTMECISVCSL